ncbi:MAG: hypothetical protein CM15mV127_070 [Caudoviricetes sp.]|nr:MAG: hypothetical protein CM15mV127_070 [Caudoviricetes sp.]
MVYLFYYNGKKIRKPKYDLVFFEGPTHKRRDERSNWFANRVEKGTRFIFDDIDTIEWI